MDSCIAKNKLWNVTVDLTLWHNWRVAKIFRTKRQRLECCLSNYTFNAWHMWQLSPTGKICVHGKFSDTFTLLAVCPHVPTHAQLNPFCHPFYFDIMHVRLQTDYLHFLYYKQLKGVRYGLMASVTLFLTLSWCHMLEAINLFYCVTKLVLSCTPLVKSSCLTHKIKV